MFVTPPPDDQRKSRTSILLSGTIEEKKKCARKNISGLVKKDIFIVKLADIISSPACLVVELRLASVDTASRGRRHESDAVIAHQVLE
jgi:hypothetical protein